MKHIYRNLMSCAVLAAAMSSNAASISETQVIDFTADPLGTQYYTNNGNLNENILVAEDPLGQKGYVLSVVKTGWDTQARIGTIVAPKGYTLADIKTITVEYYNPAEAPGKLDIMIKQPNDGPYPGTYSSTATAAASELTSGAWATHTFSASELAPWKHYVDGEGWQDDETASITSNSEFGLSVGFWANPTAYYIGSIAIEYEREVTQRELDEANLNPAASTYRLVELNFDDWAEGPSEYIGSNGGGKNRADMIIDNGPEGYSNKCVHIIYGGHTYIFLWGCVECPEGYTLDDLRKVEYDIYETEIAGKDATNDKEFPGRDGAPLLKFKEFNNAWGLQSEASSCGNTQLPTVNEWHTISFAPSAVWAATNADTSASMQQLTSFAPSIGFNPCNNQCYVDNVKFHFQKSNDPTSGVDTIVAQPAETTFRVFNLQGIQMMTTDNLADINTLAPGLYIANGKKYLVK